MNCPKCQERLVREQYRQRNYLLCFYCEGAWLNKEDIELHGVIESPIQIEAASSLLCPICKPASNLSLASVQGCQLECCKECGGMFFDKGELESFSAHYKSLDGNSFAEDASEAAIVLISIARVISSLFRLISR